MCENEQDKQHSEGGSWNYEEVEGNQVLDVVVQESPPSWRRRLSVPNHVLGHGRPEDSAHFAVQFRSSVSATAFACPEFACPETTKSVAMPTNDSSWLHDGEHLMPPGPQSG